MEAIGENSSEEKNWALVCHLAALAFFLPFGSIVGPLIIWLIKKDEYPLVEDQGKEALNFQISMFIYKILCIPLVFIVIGIPILIALVLINLILVIIAAVHAGRGERYRYPLAIKFIR